MNKKRGLNVELLGGKGEIGNNKVLISWDNNYLLLDAGTRFWDFDIFERQKMRKMDLKRLVEENIIPKTVVDVMTEKGEINIVLSHLHLDHYGLLDYSEALNEIGSTIRIFMPEDQKNLFNALIKLRRMEKDYSSYVRRKIDDLKHVIAVEDIKPIKVDHSIDAAYAYRIETKHGTVFYTGDYRFTTEKEFDELVKAAKDVDYLITEATRIVSHGLFKETSVKEAFEDIMNKDIYTGSSFYVFVGWYTHSSRVRSIIEASGGRKVVLDKKIAKIIASINPELIKSNRRVYVLAEDGEEDELREEGFQIITVEEVNEERGNVVVVLTAFDVIKLWRTKTRKSIIVNPGDVAIVSLSEPYDEEGFKRMNEMVERITEKLNMPVYFIHASGHAVLHEIVEFVQEIKPKYTYIVHSSNSKILEHYIKDVTSVYH